MNDKQVIYDICQSIEQPDNMRVLSMIDVIDDDEETVLIQESLGV